MTAGREKEVLALVLAAASFLPSVSAAADATDGIMEDILGPKDEVVAALATEASVGNADTRAEAIWKLARLDHEKCAEPLIGMIADAPPDVRPYMAMGLGWLGKKAAKGAPALSGYLTTNAPTFLASTAIWALGRMGDKDKGDVPCNTRSCKTL